MPETAGNWGTLPSSVFLDQTAPTGSQPSIKFYTTPESSGVPVAETAPSRASTFPDDAAGRKEHPVASGVIDYFPDSLVAISKVSFVGNEQHNPGQPLHWAREKSGDEGDALIRHFLQRGTLDSDGVRHSAKMAWRALALLQKEIEADQQKVLNKKDLLSPSTSTIVIGAPVKETR